MKWTRALSFSSSYDMSKFWYCVCLVISPGVIFQKRLWPVNFVQAAYTFIVTFYSSSLVAKASKQMLKKYFEIPARNRLFFQLYTIKCWWKLDLSRLWNNKNLTFYLINRVFIFSGTSKSIKVRKLEGWRNKSRGQNWNGRVRRDPFKDKNFLVPKF